MKKKILIISAVFFPRNSPRANRTTELAKEFARLGHNVTVYAVLGKYDYTEFENEYKIKVRNLGKMKYAVLNSDPTPPPYSFITKLGAKLFKKYIEFPDIELACRVYDILKINRESFDLLITVAIPFPIHWGTAYAKERVKNFPKNWIADCGDPYMGNKFLKRPFYFKYIEKWFCRKVDYLTVPVEGAIKAYYPEFRNKIKVIPQGFKIDEYSLPIYVPNKIPIFIYAGAFYNQIRDPKLFFEYLSTVKTDYKFIIYTKSHGIVKPYKAIFKDKLVIKDYIERKQVIKEFAKADFLVNFENGTEVQSPSKLIDYAIAGRPILQISNGKLNKKLISEFLSFDFRNYQNDIDLDRYDIKNVANSFLILLYND